MYGWSGFGLVAFRTGDATPVEGGRYAVPGIVRTGGAADERFTDDTVADAGFDPVMFSRGYNVAGRATRDVADTGALELLGQKVVPPIIINSSGAQATAGSQTVVHTDGGFSLSSIPWWGWLLGLGAGAYALKKGGR